ncbi:unnamed protein product [Durusdinium trenchii]|uniref:Sacsin/Nov domain-containing protein n=1 Tax=Durusdinium trenchii TaxID=1381693 RepID=A0ABP0N572_9DINO
MPKIPSAEKIQLLLEGEITGEDGVYNERTGKRKWGTSTYKVYEALAGLQEEEEAVKPYLLVWLHGMDNGSIEPGYLTTIQKRLRHRVIFVVPMSPQTYEGMHFNWGCAFSKRDNKKQLGFVHGKLHEPYLTALTSKISDLAYEFDAERVLVMGYSMGGFGAFQLGGFAPDAFDVVMSVAGYGLGTLEPEDAMYGAPQPASSAIFEDFLTGVVSELSRVPIVLAVHAQKDSMSSFRDVKAIIQSCQETLAMRGVPHTAELLEVEDRWADSDRNRKKKKISGHHYFNFSLLDESSEDFLWSKLRKYLSQAPLRLEVRPLQIDQLMEVEPGVRFKCLASSTVQCLDAEQHAVIDAEELEALEEPEIEVPDPEEDEDRVLRSRWRPPSCEEIQLFLRAGVRLESQAEGGQTPLALLCEAACLCFRDAEEETPEKLVSSDADAQDEACAVAVKCMCEEAPVIWTLEDATGRMPLTMLAEAFGLGEHNHQRGPRATLMALLDSLSFCFSKSPSSIMWTLRCSEPMRHAAEFLSRMFMKEQVPAPSQLKRLLQWMEVVMGGAWEASEDQRYLTERLLADGMPIDLEDMMNSAIHLREFSDQMEKKVLEWEAEEAELKLAEFEARCAKKASEYEDRIARLETEIARRAGNLQLLPQPPPSTNEDREKIEENPEERKEAIDDPKEDREEKPKRKVAAGPPQGRVLEEAKQVIEDIRADRLVNDGWDDGVSEDVKQGLLAMRRSLCAAVERLALDLYADECHCLWELMQNADDNKYESDDVPELTLALEVDPTYGAYVWTSNNEVGLSSEDVRAICNVNASMKGAGQTGHKGIGWKSVFRISDCPHVLSNAFAFKFDTRGPLGKLALVTPTNLSDEEVESLPPAVKEAKAAGNTVMFLPLRSNGDALAVDAELHHIAAQHLCLAFLRRLRRVRLVFAEGSMLLQRSAADMAKLYFPGASNLVAVKMTEFTEAGEKSRTQMPEYVLHHHEVSLQGETATLTLAFPVAFALDTTQRSEEDDELLKAPLQPLYTFLPVKVVGFRFAIQGPFDLTADRGNLHGKSTRNRSLCASVPVAFKAALQNLPGLRSRALDLLGQETPEATWLLVRGQLLEVLKDVECIPTEPDGQLARPGDCLLPPEEPKLAEAMQHLPPQVLWEHCQRCLVQRPWALRHRAQTQGLGLQELCIDHWLQVLQVDTGDDQDNTHNKRSLAQDAAEKQDYGFFKRLLSLLGTTLGDKPEVLARLKGVPLLPDATGHALRVADGPTFSCYATDVPQCWQKKLEAAGAMRVLCDKVHGGLEAAGLRFLRQLGVSRPTRQDIVPLCVEWHLGLAETANFQVGGSSSTTHARLDDTGVEPLERLRCAVWASLACLRQHFLNGASGVPSKEEVLPWSALSELLIPCSSIRSGFGTCSRLTCPTYLGEAAGSELQQDVLVAIMGFIHGVEAEVRDIGIFADPPPSWLRDDEKESVRQSKGATVRDKLNWEAFLDELGMKPLSPCTSHRKVAGTVLTIDLGWRLSSCDWWGFVCDSVKALSYVERRLKNADRVEITWLRQLRTPERVDVSELFLRSNYLRFGGHFLPYMDLQEDSQAMGCLQRLQVATELNGPGLRKCLHVLKMRSCHDISVFADLYSALHSLPKEQQSSMNLWGAQEDPGQFQVFVPPSSFEAASRCLWTDSGRSCLRWLCGYQVLQPDYGPSVQDFWNCVSMSIPFA